MSVSGSISAQQAIRNTGNLNLFTGAEIGIFGNLDNNGPLNSLGGRIYFTGTSAQSFLGSSQAETFDVSINNSNGLTLSNNSIRVSNELFLTSGILTSYPNGLVILTDDALTSGASTLSYVDGPIRKIGNDPFTFPVGNLGNYAPISMSAPSSITDAYTSTYFRSNGAIDFNNTLELGIDHISTCEYWQIDRTTGSSQVLISPTWNVNSCGVTDLADLLVVKWDSTLWRNIGNGGTNGTLSQGTIAALSPSEAYGIFTLASTSTQNPLPIELISFNAIRKGEIVKTEWATASERDNDFFVVERSENGFLFDEIGTIEGAGNSNTLLTYQHYDIQPLNGINYYRLKQVDFNGEPTYSAIKSIYFSNSQELIVFPTTCNGNSISYALNIEWKAEQVTILNALGQTVYAQALFTETTYGTFEVKFPSQLASGSYQLLISNGEQQISNRFIVQ
jgi:hypothetical protein